MYLIFWKSQRVGVQNEISGVILLFRSSFLRFDQVIKSMGNCLWMAFLIDKQILGVSYQWCLKHNVLIYTWELPPMFLLSFFWLLGLQCLLLPLPIPLLFLMPSLHSVLFMLSRKIMQDTQGWLSYAGRGGYTPSSGPLFGRPALSPLIRERRALSWVLDDERPARVRVPTNQTLSGTHGEPERAHPVALGPARRVRRETEMDQKSWWEY